MRRKTSVFDRKFWLSGSMSLATCTARFLHSACSCSRVSVPSRSKRCVRPPASAGRVEDRTGVVVSVPPIAHWFFSTHRPPDDDGLAWPGVPPWTAASVDPRLEDGLAFGG